MLTPKIVHTNIKKQESFVVGGYARTRYWGTRVYKVIAYQETRYRQATRDVNGQFVFGDWTVKRDLTLMKIGETNKGKFRFTNSKPFKPARVSAYYPAKAI